MKAKTQTVNQKNQKTRKTDGYKIAAGVLGLNLNWPARIVFVRHGESEGNKYGRHHMATVMMKPSHNYSLTPTGRVQAEAAGAYIHNRFGAASFDAYFTSTYVRAQQTFAHMFKGKRKCGRKIVPIIDARVNEISRGFASIISKEDIEAAYPHDITSYELNGWFHNIPLGGQSCVQIEHVIHGFLAYLREGCAGKNVIVVGHCTWINLCCRILMNRTWRESQLLHEAQYFKNGSITIFERADDGVLVQIAENIVPYDTELTTIQYDN